MAPLLINGVPINCINQAAVEYHVPATLIISVLKIENGYPGTVNLNSNGTRDYGPMQINSIWLSKIRPFGYTRYLIQNNPCANVAVGTWILSQEIAQNKLLWKGVGDYHSHTFTENQSYSSKVKRIYLLLKRYLATTTS